MPITYKYNPLIPNNLDMTQDVDAAMSHFVGVSGICKDANKLGARIAQFRFDANSGAHLNFCLNATIDFVLQQISPYGNNTGNGPGSRTYVPKSGTLNISIALGEIGDSQTTTELVALTGCVNMNPANIRLVKTVVPQSSAIYDLYLETSQLGERFFFTMKSNADTNERITAEMIIGEDLIATPYTQIQATLFSDDKTHAHTVLGVDTVTITHGLKKYPSVTIIDSNGNMCLADVHYDDMNTITVTFTETFSGQIICN